MPSVCVCVTVRLGDCATELGRSSSDIYNSSPTLLVLGHMGAGPQGVYMLLAKCADWLIGIELVKNLIQFEELVVVVQA